MNGVSALKTWDLTQLAPHHDSPAFQETWQALQQRAHDFQARRSLLTDDVSSDSFYRTIHLYEEAVEDVSKLNQYANLLFASDTSDETARSLVTRVNNVTAKIGNQLLFFTLWWKRGIDEQNARRLVEDAEGLKYYLTRARRLARYTLSEPEEKVINIKDTTGIDFARKLYDQYTERFLYHATLDGAPKELLKSELTAYFHSPNPANRENAYRALFEVYGRNADILGELYRNTVVEWQNETDLRGYESPIAVRNIANDIPDAAVETLLAVCRKNKHVFQRYFEEKGTLLGLKQMTRYHLYAPIDVLDEKRIAFDEAVKLVLRSLEDFTPKMANLALNVLTENHIDAGVRKGKRSGAFCSTASPSVTPYVLLNYTGRQRDVFTLAHELGHAVHSQLAAEKSILIQHAPLPLAELASVFSEMIVLDRTLETSTDQERKRLRIHELDDYYATILRQAYFTIFELDAHEAISKGATVSEISTIYYATLEEQFGGAVDVPEEFRFEWTYIPHFYHTPFYTYAYSFGNLLTVSLYNQYKERGDAFIEDYLDILASGGSKNPASLLEVKGIDIQSEAFWQGGFDYIADRVVGHP
jgi:oligoendopeptidase F